MAKNPKDITGQRFGKLIALKLHHIEKIKTGTVHFWLCQCDCGNTKIIRKVDLLRGKIQSCGCFLKESVQKRAIKHNYFNSKPYHVWHDIKQRCFNKKNKAFKHYGARGITLCKEWQDPKIFCEWAFANGFKEGLSIDRIDVNGNYEPFNCRWVDMRTQQRNKRTNNNITICNETHCITDWTKILGISISTIKKLTDKDLIEYYTKKQKEKTNENW